MEIVANGRGDWIGWIELAKEAVDETATRITARVIRDTGAHVLGLVEVEDRPALLRFNRDLLRGLYRHVMLVDGNDDRGIDKLRLKHSKKGIHRNKCQMFRPDYDDLLMRNRFLRLLYVERLVFCPCAVAHTRIPT